MMIFKISINKKFKKIINIKLIKNKVCKISKFKIKIINNIRE